MPLYDTLTAGGVEKTLTDWGFNLSSCFGDRPVSAVGTWSGTIETANIADDPIFAFETTAVIQTGRSSATGAVNTFTGGVIKFNGVRVDDPVSNGSSGQGVSYTFQDAYYDLEHTPYQQHFSGAAPTAYPISEVVLFTSTNGAPNTTLFVSVGDTIQDILQWLLDQYSAQGMAAPYQYKGRLLNAGHIDLNTTGGTYNFGIDPASTIDPGFFGLFYPSKIERPMMCARALEKCLEYLPRYCIALDHSTTPPTLHVKSVDNFASVTLPLFDGLTQKNVNIKRRDDLVLRSVLLTYRITSTVDGSPVIDYAVDKWGPNGFNSSSDPSSGRRVLVDFIDMQGANQTDVTGHLDCETLVYGGSATQAQKRAWWSSRRGGEAAKLIDSRIRFQTFNATGTVATEAVIPNATLSYATAGLDTTGMSVSAGQELTSADYAFYTNRLVRGTYHTWMKLADNVAVKSIKVRVTSSMSYGEYDKVTSGDTLGIAPTDESVTNTDTSGVSLGVHNSQEHHVNIEITNGITNPYSAVQSITPGETIPIIGEGGIAQYLFNAASVYQYEGEYVKIGVPFDNGVSVLNKLNLSGGKAEWLTMNAQIRGVRDDYGTHETSVSIGPLKHLSAAQMISYMNMWRDRRTWYNPATRTDNTVTNGSVVMPDAAAQANSTDGNKNSNQGSFVHYTTPGVPGSGVAGQINHDAKVVAAILAATTPTPVDSTPINTIAAREMRVCDEDGTPHYAIVMMSGFYDKP